MTSPASEERRRKLAAAQQVSRSEKQRLAVLVVGLLLVVSVFVMLQNNLQQIPAEEETRQPQIQSAIAPPPVDFELLSGVKDSTPSERLILEPEPFRHLTRVAVGLQRGHLRALGNPELPFDELETSAASLRGKPFRVRGELLHYETLKRAADAPPEYWTWLKTDSGQDVFFVSMRPPDDLFNEENFIKADGFFFKYYSWKIPEGERLEAPLMIGRQFVPSYREAAATMEIDYGLLADIRTPAMGSVEGPNEKAKWHLLNVARTVAADETPLEERFADAPVLKLSILTELAAQPSVFRGKPMIVSGVISDEWAEELQENPLRLEWETNIYLRNLGFGDNLVRIIAPGRLPRREEGIGSGEHQYFGWFQQLESYLDTRSEPRRAPVFVVAGVRWIDVPPPTWIQQLMLGFLGLALALGFIIYMMIRRDKRKAEEMSKRLAERRRKRRTETTPA